LCVKEIVLYQDFRKEVTKELFILKVGKEAASIRNGRIKDSLRSIGNNSDDHEDGGYEEYLGDNSDVNVARMLPEEELNRWFKGL